MNNLQRTIILAIIFLASSTPVEHKYFKGRISNDVLSSCEVDPCNLPEVCEVGSITSNPRDCSTFYMCNAGLKWELMDCGDLMFDTVTCACNFPEMTECQEPCLTTSTTKQTTTMLETTTVPSTTTAPMTTTAPSTSEPPTTTAPSTTTRVETTTKPPVTTTRKVTTESEDEGDGDFTTQPDYPDDTTDGTYTEDDSAVTESTSQIPTSTVSQTTEKLTSTVSQTTTEKPTTTVSLTTTPKQTTTIIGEKSECELDPCNLPPVCFRGSIVPDPRSCTHYLECGSSFNWLQRPCPDGTYFSRIECLCSMIPVGCHPGC